MNRTNANTNNTYVEHGYSLWEDTASLPTFPKLDGDANTDVLIIGGGMAGLLCAYLLEQRGVNYILAEAHTICSGVSGNTTAKITAQHGLIYDKLIHTYGTEYAQLYLQANQEAIAQYRSLCNTIACDFEEKDAYVYTTAHPEKLETELTALHKIGSAADFTTALPLPFPVQGAIRFPNQAQFHPLKFAQAIAQGLHIYEHTPVETFDGKRFRTPHGTITAEKVIVATHFPLFNKHGGYFLKLYQHRSYVLGLHNAPDVNGMYIDEAENGLSLRNHGDLLLLGGGSHRTGKAGGSWNELAAFAQKNYPNAQIQYAWATQDCMTLDHIPYIGQYAKNTPTLYVATGFHKWGMTAAITAANLLADLVQEKENPYTELFSPSRSILRPQLFMNMLESTANLLTLTKPRCPHMGCALKWNAQEHSWDCSCHGSRFSAAGKLLDNPATSDTKMK